MNILKDYAQVSNIVIERIFFKLVGSTRIVIDKRRAKTQLTDSYIFHIGKPEVILLSKFKVSKYEKKSVSLLKQELQPDIVLLQTIYNNDIKFERLYYK